MSTRTCKVCRREFPNSDFAFVTPVGHAGYGAVCLGCRPHGETFRKVKARAFEHRFRARSHGVRSTLTGDELVQAFARSDGRCYYCQEEVGYAALTIDHRVPFAAGGENVAENIVAACKPCNSRKWASTTTSEGDMAKVQFNVRLEARVLAQIKAIKEELGVSEADVVRLAVRLLATRDLKTERSMRKKK